MKRETDSLALGGMEFRPESITGDKEDNLQCQGLPFITQPGTVINV